MKTALFMNKALKTCKFFFALIKTCKKRNFATLNGCIFVKRVIQKVIV